MPAIMTHHLFGEDAAKLLGSDMLSSEEELLAFLLGNQGPDPFFACYTTTPARGARCRKLGGDLHERRVSDALWTLRDAVGHLRLGDEKIGRAWVLGYVGHYALDSTAHPLIYAQQYRLTEEGYGLEGAGNVVHALLESELDVWMLRQLRGMSVTELSTTSYLARNERILWVAGALMAHVALQVFGVSINGGAYGAAVDDFDLLYRINEPINAPHARIAAKLEQLIRPHHHSLLAAMAHLPSDSDSCPAANLSHTAWLNPADHTPRTESFPDLYHAALERWDKLVDALLAGNRESVHDIVANINFDGMPDKGYVSE